jgi:PHD/YefM family antitoxin component YafN of YafNO toxin-antitoxin module
MRELKNTAEVSELCRKSNDPIFVTKNGYSDMVIMSAETFERDYYAAYVRNALAEAETAFAKGERGRDFNEVISELRVKHESRN